MKPLYALLCMMTGFFGTSLCAVEFGPDSTNQTGSLSSELILFEAYRVDDQAELKWITASEQNLDHFEVQRSVDNEQWTKVFDIDGAGTSSQAIEYFDIDYETPSLQTFYRLKYIGDDGSSFVSQVAVVPAVNELEVSEERLLKSFPDNIKEGNLVNLTFENPNQKDLILVLRAVNGQEFFAKVNHMGDEESYMVTDASTSIPAGNYIITATSENDFYNRTLIVE